MKLYELQNHIVEDAAMYKVDLQHESKTNDAADSAYTTVATDAEQV